MSCTCLPCKIMGVIQDHFDGGSITNEQHAEMMDALARTAGPNLADYTGETMHAFVGLVVAYRRIKRERQTAGAESAGAVLQ